MINITQEIQKILDKYNIKDGLFDLRKLSPRDRIKIMQAAQHASQK